MSDALTFDCYGTRDHADLQPADCVTCAPTTPTGATDRSAILADSDHARLLAIEALQHGRLEMGLGFARLALNAARAARAIPYRLPGTFRGTTVNVPLMGQTRDEAPAPVCTCTIDTRDGRVVDRESSCPRHGQPRPCPDHESNQLGCSDCSTIRYEHYRDLATPTAIFNAVDTASLPVPKSSRCQHSTRMQVSPLLSIQEPGDAPSHPCWGPIYLEQNTGVWRHVNAPLDAHHTPIPREADQ